MAASLTLRMLGVLAFLGTAVMLAGLFFGLAYAAGKGDGRLARRLGIGAAVIAAGYAALLLAGPIVTPARPLPPGAELSFCGFDCHLHVSATSTRRAESLEITLRFRSDAKRAPEHPGSVRVRVVDASGREFAPASPVPDGELAAGHSVSHTLRFDVPPDAEAPRVLLMWDGWIDYLVAGPQNPLVQRKASLLLAGAP
jgi:hypothetical protein